MTRPRFPLINASDAVHELRRTWGVQLTPATIRQWAARGHIGSHSLRRERYDLREIVAHAAKRGLIALDREKCHTSCQRYKCHLCSPPSPGTGGVSHVRGAA